VPRLRPLRIVYVHQYYTNLAMGGGTRSFELARRLVAQGHEVHVLTTRTEARRRSLRWRRTVEAGVQVHWFDVPYDNSMSYRRRIKAFAEFAATATARAISLDPDLVFATSTPLTVAVPGVVAARVRRVPFVFEVRDLWPEVPIALGALRGRPSRRLAFALARWAYRNAQAVVALSPGMAAGVAAHGVGPERIAVVPNACDVSLFQVDAAAVRAFRDARPWLQDRKLVVYAGTLGLANRVEYLVDVAAEVARRDPEVRFLVLGRGKEHDHVAARARAAGVLDTSLFMTGFVAKSEMPVVLGAATIATSLFAPNPALHDNSANKFFDALAAGRPVAINYGGWHADLLRESGAGLVLDPENVPASAAALVAAIDDAAWLRQAGAAARALAADRFDRDVLFEVFSGVLTGAADSDRRAGR